MTEHLEDYGNELLLHLLVADLRRLAVEWFGDGRNEPLGRLLEVLETGLREGDGDVKNPVVVSFVEDTGWWDESMQPFISLWPTGLADELERQRKHRRSSRTSAIQCASTGNVLRLILVGEPAG